MNMKIRIDYKSIKFKVILYFFVFTVIIGCMIWYLQVFFLSNYYDKMKILESENSVAKISELYHKSTLKDFVEKVDELTDNNDLLVQVISDDETLFSSSSQLEAYKNEIERGHTLLKKSGGKDGVSLILKGTKSKRETWVYAGYLDSSKHTLLYVVSPLYPVTSTVKIIQQQLIYILLLSFLISLGLAFYTSRRISTPIENISKKAKLLAIGKTGIRFDDKYSYTEIDNLAENLNRASIEIDKSMELQKDLIANISHDLKTPLTMVKSYAEMIRDLSGDFPDKRNAHLQVIIDESDRLNSLVNDILTLSSVQSGTLKLEITKFSIKDLFQSVIQPYYILKNQGYKIMFNCRQDVDVKGDPDKIKQVVSNLVTNAIKYCGEDKEIFINVKKWGKRVHCEIVDHGQGIKADELPYIWERYYQSSTNHVRTTKGSGIGLSIVKEILNAHNARYGAESKVGRGTTFWFELDVAESDE